MFDQLSHVVDQVAKDKGIERDILIETVEAAVKTAAKRALGDQRDIEAQYNEENGEVELFQVIQVVDDVENPFREVPLDVAETLGLEAEPGDELLFQIFYLPRDRERAVEQDKKYGEILKLESARATFGRIAAQTAKQVIIQRIREAEREMIFNDYKDRQAELITGIVRRFEKGNIIVDLGRADAILPVKEQTPRESYRAGDRIQGFVKEVRRSSRDPQIVLSRADPGLVIKLFQQEVPEIHEGVVKIVAVAREAGTRTKVAVYSTDRDVDPVGACVGMRGSRVQAVVQELRGEKIDIVPYNPDPARFVCSAISPAEVLRVLVDEGNMSMELIVPDDQLSLAIGRGGQNVRLAAQLTGWDLDIISESRLKAIMNEARRSLLEYEGVSEDMIDTLFSLGYTKLEDIAMAEVQEIAQIPGYGEERARTIVAAADAILNRPSEEVHRTPEEEAQYESLLQVRGVGQKGADALFRAGYRTSDHLFFEEDPERLDVRTGIGLKKAKQILHAVREMIERGADFDEEVWEAKREQWEAELVDLEPPPLDPNQRIQLSLPPLTGDDEGEVVAEEAAPAGDDEGEVVAEEAAPAGDDEGEVVAEEAAPAGDDEGEVVAEEAAPAGDDEGEAAVEEAVDESEERPAENVAVE